ncbi:MAG: hypothetical protein JXB50_04265, partial [Spirochaetes bacterium]|nr:hypothetical protein [Spirochaetota bacterium]
MNHKNKNILYKLLFFLPMVIFLTCITLPKEYVPDDKIIYLKQPYYLTPVKYKPEKASPYKWDVDPEVDPVNPGILTLSDYNTLLKPDIYLDAKIYKETKGHLQLMKEDPVYLSLKEQLLNIKVEKPLPRKIIKGEKTKDYNNAVEYQYPEEEKALISFFHNNEIKITFKEGRKYFYKTNGDYFEEDAKGTELYAVFEKNNSFRINMDGINYYRSDKEQKLTLEQGEIMKFIEPFPQYSYKPKDKKYKYIFFVEDFINEKIDSIALLHDNDVRYDYLYKTDAVLVTFKEIEAIAITNEFQKSQHYFNKKTRTTEALYSYYFPEGIRIADIHKPLTYSSINPIWPENYLEKKMGYFKIFYTKKDEQLLNKINAQKLLEINLLVKRLTGINFSNDRAVVLPPDLESYRKLHARKEDEILYWYPSGFQTKDMIIMWPPSVKRYEGEEGDKYFWEKEFYEILAHELAHLAIGEVTSVFSPVPVWLNEGMAIYIESTYSPDTKHYWDIAFNVSHDR